VGELAGQLAQAAGSLAALDLVGPVLLEPPRSLPLGEPLASRPQVPQEEVYSLLGIDG
jgi:hypothetical protein